MKKRTTYNRFVKYVPVFLFIGILFSTVACGKYEEGPALSLRTKKKRVTGTWKLDYVAVNGEDITEDVLTNLGHDYRLHIEKDGVYHKIGANVKDDGTWEFAEDKYFLHLLSDIPGAEAEHFEIRRLKSDEMWLRHAHEVHVFDVHYVK